MDDLEDRIYAHQERVIREKYGKEAADQANYGWGVDERDDSITVETKIYGDEPMVLVTFAKFPDYEFYDSWRSY